MPPKGKTVEKVVKGRGRPAKQEGDPKTKKVADHTSFNRSIYRVLKQVHPNHRMSKKTMEILNSFCHDFFGAVCDEARDINNRHKGKTIGGREVQAAVRLLLPGEICTQAVTEATKAVARAAN